MTDRPLRSRLFRMFVGALVGMALGGIAAATGALDWLKTLSGEDVATTLLAVMLLFLAGFAALVSSSQGAYRRIAENYREGDPLDTDVLRITRISALILLISGALLLAPVVAARFPTGEQNPVVIAAAMGILVLIVTWLSLRILRSGDELNRAASAEGSVISFWVLQIGLFLWASLAKLGLVAEVSLWTLMLIATAVHLVVSIGVAMRRGMFS